MKIERWWCTVTESCSGENGKTKEKAGKKASVLRLGSPPRKSHLFIIFYDQLSITLTVSDLSETIF